MEHSAASSPNTPNRSGRLIRLLLASIFFTTACAAITPPPRDPATLPPILAQDEIFRPYTKVGTVEVSRNRMGHIDDLREEGEEWAYDALAAEAARMGADAVILPEIRAEKGTYLLFPSTSIKARGIAIRFN